MKREPVGNEREQDGWLGSALGPTRARASDGCVDAETLAAWADGGLSAKAASAVELHVSSCSRCMGVLAAMERAAPAARARHAWTPIRVFRWLAPLAAAATAVAIWIVVPDRPITPIAPAPAHDLSAPEPGTQDPLSGPSRGTQNPLSALEPGTQNQLAAPEPRTQNRLPPAEPRTQNQLPPAEPRTQNQLPAAEPRTQNQNPAPSTQNLEPQVQHAPSARVDKPAAAEEQLQMRDELRRERAASQELGAAAAGAPEAPSPAAPSAAAPTARAPAAAADSVAETSAATAQRSAFKSVAMSTDSVSPSNRLIRWRIVASVSIERTLDGGKTWMKTTPPASTFVGVRAVDGNRAVATTSDRSEFYTTNGGRSWTRVQENSSAPF